METDMPTLCYNCSQPLPSAGFFCGACLTQFKCKSCSSVLEPNYLGCVNCGTPKQVRENTNTTSQQNTNTFRLHETPTDRIIEATFSNDVAKDLAATLRDAAAAGRIKAISSTGLSSNNSNEAVETAPEFSEAEVLKDDNTVTKGEAINKPASDDSSGDVQYPALKAIAMKNLPKSETEWIVIYAFYASNYGKEIFDRDNVINQYIESNRFNKDTTKRDLSTNFKRAVVGGYINPLQKGYSILEEGIKKAKEIISRTSSSSPKISKVNKNTAKKTNSETEENGTKASSKTIKKKVASSGKPYKRLTDINFYPSDNDSLVDFMKKFKVKSNDERNLLFTYYLQTILKINPVDLNHLFTCYYDAGSPIPENMDSSLNNTNVRKGWLETKDSAIIITTRGTNKIKFWDKKEA